VKRQVGRKNVCGKTKDVLHDVKLLLGRGRGAAERGTRIIKPHTHNSNSFASQMSNLSSARAPTRSLVRALKLDAPDNMLLDGEDVLSVSFRRRQPCAGGGGPSLCVSPCTPPPPRKGGGMAMYAPDAALDGGGAFTPWDLVAFKAGDFVPTLFTDQPNSDLAATVARMPAFPGTPERRKRMVAGYGVATHATPQKKHQKQKKRKRGYDDY
jgi:hypothetical protein